MHSMAKVSAAASVLLLLGAFNTASADDYSQTNVPASQGLESVNKNLAKDPDNPGLQNAQQRIEDNIQDRADRSEDGVDRDDLGVERPERPEQPERPDRPERGGRF